MKQILLILLALTCVLFPAPAGSNGPNEEPTEQPSIESSGSKNGDDEEERTDAGSNGPNKEQTEPPIKPLVPKNGDDEKERTECPPKKTDDATCPTETIPPTDFYGPNAILNILNFIFNFFPEDFNTDDKSKLALPLVVLAVSLALTTRQAILGFLQLSKLGLSISTCLIVFAGIFVWSSDMGEKWMGLEKLMVLLEILIPVVFILGILVYCYLYLLPRLAIGLFVLVVSVILPVFLLGVDKDVPYDIGIAEFCGIGGGALLAYKNRGPLISAWKKFRNQFSRRKSGKDENERENKKNEG